MIACRICGDTNGPWIHVKDFGYVCEECERNPIKQRVKQSRKAKKERLKHDS